MTNYEIRWTNNSDFRTFQNYNKHTKSQKELYETIDHLRAHSPVAALSPQDMVSLLEAEAQAKS